MIKLTHSTVELDDGINNYKDTHANLMVHSGGGFTGLPEHIRNYERRNTGQEFWMDFTVPDDPKQLTPDQSFIDMMDTIYGDIPSLLNAQTQETSKVYDIINTPLIIESGQGDINPFEFQWNEPIEVDSEIVLRIEESTRQAEGFYLSIPVTETPFTLELEFEQVGGYIIKPQGVNQVDEYIIRIFENA